MAVPISLSDFSLLSPSKVNCSLLNNTKIMNNFHGGSSFIKQVIPLLIILVFFETPVIATARLSLSDSDEFSGREELVKWAGYGEEKLSTVVISGRLNCRRGGAKRTASLHQNPVSGAIVGLFCGTKVKRGMSLAKGSTNSYGEFLIDLPSHLHAIPNLEQICRVKVTRLPKGCHSRQLERATKYQPIKLSSASEGFRAYNTDTIDLIKSINPVSHKNT